LYDSEDFFAGQAIFGTENERYNARLLQARNDSTKSNNQDKKINIQLKIFEENEKPQISYPLYYNKSAATIFS
jgi:hypothetical protein